MLVAGVEHAIGGLNPMPCKECSERRAAILKAWQEKQFAEAVRLAAGGVKEMVRKKEDGNA